MALNTYLTLTLDGTAVQGGVTQKGREGTIMVTSLDWSEAYSSLAQAWMTYYRYMCRAGGDPGVAAAAAIGPTQNQPVPTYPAGNAPMIPGGAPGYPGLPPMMGR